MDRAIEIGRVSTKGSLHLMWGLAISTVISAVGVIVIANLLGEAEYGIYNIALIAPNFIVIFRDWGINSAIIKYAAQYKAEKKIAELRNIVVSGLIFEIAVGLVLTAVSFLLSGFLASAIFQRPNIAPLIETASLLILAGAIFNAATSTFTGFERMELRSITVVCQSIIKTILIIILVLTGFGATGAVTGNAVGVMIASIIGMFLMWRLYKSLTIEKPVGRETLSNIKTMLKYGLPLSMSTIVLSSLTQFYYFLMAIYAGDALVGNYNVALNFVLLITFVATPITTALLPAFSKLDRKRDGETLKNVFQFSIKYSALATVPVAAMIMALAHPAIATLFGNRYNEAPLFLALSATHYLFSALGNLGIGNLLAGQGETTFTLKISLLHAAIGFPLGALLISQFSILGLIITTVTSGIPGLIVAITWARRHYDVTIDMKSSAKILFCSAISAVTAYVLVNQINLASWIELTIGVLVFVLVFILTIPATGTIDQADLANIREIATGLGVFQKPINILLKLMEKITNKIKS